LLEFKFSQFYQSVAPYRLINTVEPGYNVMCRYKRALFKPSGIMLWLTVRN